MNLAGYQGKRDWNMVHVAANVLLKGMTSPRAAVKTWGRSALRLSRARRRGGFRPGNLRGVLAAGGTSPYSFVRDPARKLYQTPNSGGIL